MSNMASWINFAKELWPLLDQFESSKISIGILNVKCVVWPPYLNFIWVVIMWQMDVFSICTINCTCIEKFPGDLKTYMSAESIQVDDHKEAVPVEYLTINPSGISEHKLSLKTGAPNMLLRNQQSGPNLSLRLFCKWWKEKTLVITLKLWVLTSWMMERILEVEVAVGMNKGLKIFLPRVPQYDKSGDYPFTLMRRQYPVRYVSAPYFLFLNVSLKVGILGDYQQGSRELD